MAETKKRFRPTLTAYRALENEVSKFKEMNARLIGDNQSLVDKNHTLEQSNTLMEQELDRVRKANLELCTLSSRLSNELREIKSRGFWKRLFNCE
jgi:hypothetical protein